MIPALLAALPAVASIGSSLYGLFNKQKSGTENQQSALNRYISNNQGDIRGKTLYHTMMQPAIRQAAQQREQGARSIENMYNRGDIGASGMAQSNLTLSGKLGSNIADMSDRAMTQQIQNNLQKQQQIEQARMNISQLKDADAVSKQNAQTQNIQGMIQSLGSLGGAIGGIMGSISDSKAQQGLFNAIQGWQSEGLSNSQIMENASIFMLKQG